MAGQHVRRWRRWLGLAIHVPSWSPAVLSHAALLGSALLVSYSARAAAALDTHPIDFSIFHASTREWLAGRPMYCATCEQVNYNPPQFHLLLLPFAWLSPRLAYVLWTLSSIGAGALTLRLVMQESSARWHDNDRRVLMAAATTCAGVAATVLLGQVALHVALVVSLAWRAARHGQWARAGVWLGLAISLKPFLLLLVPVLAARRRWRAATAALLAAAASAAVGIVVFGWTAFGGWVTLLQRPAPVEHLQFFINASWSGVVARSHIPLAAGMAGSLLIAAATLAGVRRGSEDRAWLVGLCAALLASPLGWIYYLPLMTGPLVVMAQARRLPAWAWALWPLFVFPPLGQHLFQGSALTALTLGSAYAWLLLGLWIAALRAESHRIAGVATAPL